MTDIDTVAWAALYTMSNALLSWAILFVILASLVIAELYKKLNLMCVARSLSFFGLFPYFVFGFILFTMFPYEAEVLGAKIYLPQIVCCVLATAFATVYAASAQYSALDARVRDLVQLTGSEEKRARWMILGPLCGPPVVVAMRTGWPITVLMILLFEWGRGDLSGLGGRLQGAISTGQSDQILTLVVPIVLISGSVYLFLEYLDSVIRRRLEIDALDLYGMSPRLTLRSQLCIIAALGIFIALWHAVFSFPSLDETQRYGPLKFVGEVLSPGTRLATAVSSSGFREAVFNSIALALVASFLGTLVATVCALFAMKSQLFRHGMMVLTQLSQAVPIFVFIPVLFGVFRNTMIVAILILVSATYFRAYEYIRGELAASYVGWRELVSLAGSPGSLSAWISKFRAVEFRILMAAMSRSSALVFPYSITAAVIADLFLNLKGMGWLVYFEARGDVPMTLAVCLVILSVGVFAEFVAAVVARTSRPSV